MKSYLIILKIIGHGRGHDTLTSSILEISQISEMKLDPLQVKESWMAGTRTRGTQRDGSRTPVVLAGGTSQSHSSRWAHTVGPTAASTAPGARDAGTSNGTTTATHSRGAEVCWGGPPAAPGVEGGAGQAGVWGQPIAASIHGRIIHEHSQDYCYYYKMMCWHQLIWDAARVVVPST